MKNKMIRALVALGEWETTATSTVADTTVYVGLEHGKGRVVVDVEGENLFVVDGAAEAIKAGLNLFIFGETSDDAAAYALAEPLQPIQKPGQGVSPCRWIP